MIPRFTLYREISIAGMVTCMPTIVVFHRHIGMSLVRLLGPDTKEEKGAFCPPIKLSDQVTCCQHSSLWAVKPEQKSPA